MMSLKFIVIIYSTLYFALLLAKYVSLAIWYSLAFGVNTLSTDHYKLRMRIFGFKIKECHVLPRSLKQVLTLQMQKCNMQNLVLLFFSLIVWDNTIHTKAVQANLFQEMQRRFAIEKNICDHCQKQPSVS